MTAVGYDAYLVGTTVGQIAVYSNDDNRLIKMLVNEGLSVYEAAFSMKTRRMALACDGGLALIYEMDNYEKVGQISAQRPDITSLFYVKDDVLVVGQVGGYMDVVQFTDTHATVTHSLQIKEAGDINSMQPAPGDGCFMIACQKGLILSQITPQNTFTINAAVDEFVGLYGVNLCWGGGLRYVVTTSRPRFANKKEVPAGEENYAVISYTYYDGDQLDPDNRQVILGQFKTGFVQATFSIAKVAVINPRV